MSHANTAAIRTIAASRVKRWALAFVGVVCVGLAAAGAVTPGLPTTVFLIVASACFTRSCPWLEQRLLRNRFFAPYLRYVDGEPMPDNVRIGVIGVMWLFCISSAALLHLRDALPTLLGVVLIGGAAVGSIFVWRWRRSAGQGPSMAPPRDSYNSIRRPSGS